MACFMHLFTRDSVSSQSKLILESSSLSDTKAHSSVISWTLAALHAIAFITFWSGSSLDITAVDSSINISSSFLKTINKFSISA